MRQLKKIIEKLHTSRYLNAAIDATGYISNTELLENGVKYSDQISNHWRNTHSLDNEVAANLINTSVDFMAAPLNRFNFVYSKQFHEEIKYFRSNSNNKQYPSILKTVQTATIDELNAPNKQHNAFISCGAGKHTFLVTDLIVHHAQGFSKFFNSQRECKIWWMRFSSDPSRYFLEPYHLTDIPNFKLPTGAQSITIKSKLPYATLEVESITIVPLAGASLTQSTIQHLSNKSDHNMPAVIRSVINLHAATGAILFDSADNDRENTLLLNRKLAPVQCAVACYHKGKNTNDLEDLCLHIQFVLKRSGLRMLSENIAFTESLEELDVGLQKCDCIGIPYTLIINESTLNTGLLKLRSRDTMLEEVIHISDIPSYLLQIFTT